MISDYTKKILSTTGLESKPSKLSNRITLKDILGETIRLNSIDFEMMNCRIGSNWIQLKHFDFVLITVGKQVKQFITKQ